MSLLGFPDCIPIDIDPCFDVVEGIEVHELDCDSLLEDVHPPECCCDRCGLPFLFPFPLG